MKVPENGSTEQPVAELLAEIRDAAEEARGLEHEIRRQLALAREALTKRNRLMFEASQGARVSANDIAEASQLRPSEVRSIIADWRRAPEPGDTITLLCPSCQRQGGAHVPEDADPTSRTGSRAALRCPKCGRAVHLAGLRMNAQGVWYEERELWLDDW